MTRRGPAALVAALLVIGAVAGFAAAATLAGRSTDSSAEPLSARSPSVPLSGPSVRPGPTHAPLPTDLAMVEAAIGRVRFLVPAGWARTVNAANEVKWKVRGNPDGTFVLRVEQVASLDLGVAEHRQAFAEELRRRETDVRILDPAGDDDAGTLEFTYVDDSRRLRHGFVRWLDLSDSGEADVEVAVSGRPEDEAGAAQLVARVSDSMRLERP